MEWHGKSVLFVLFIFLLHKTIAIDTKAHDIRGFGKNLSQSLSQVSFLIKLILCCLFLVNLQMPKIIKSCFSCNTAILIIWKLVQEISLVLHVPLLELSKLFYCIWLMRYEATGKYLWKVLNATCSGEIIYNYLYPSLSNIGNILVMHIHLPDIHCDVSHFHPQAFVS